MVMRWKCIVKRSNGIVKRNDGVAERNNGGVEFCYATANARKEMFMTREDFLTLAEVEFANIQNLFRRKNESYGQNNDLFHNFRSTAKRVLNDCSFSSMFKVLFAYMDKHLVAVANRGLDDQEFEERRRLCLR